MFLGVDVSTTGAKALVVDKSGRVVAEANNALKLSTPRPLWSEQSPHDWWDAVVKSIRQVLVSAGIAGDSISAVGLTGQMHGLVLLDEDGEVLRPAILWNDQRCGAECDEIRSRLGKERLIQITGNDALTGFTAPKLVWVQKNEPEVYRRARHVLLPKDYVRYRLTGQFGMDKADGSGTILFDLAKRNWSGDVLAALDIPPEWMPPTFEGPEFTGEVNKFAADATGLRVGTPVAAGGGDQAAQSVGVGVVKSGTVALTLGTSGVVFAATESPLVEPQGRLHAFCHAIPGRWHLMGVMLSAAGSLQWHRDTIAPETGFDELVNAAEAAPAGSDGLIFLPYLTGERTPYPDPFARAGWIGLTVRHSLQHMTRAVLEGVAFGLNDGFELIKSAGLGAIEQVRVSGGGAKSRVWKQIIADILGVQLVTVNTTEGAAYGAALLAAVGAGQWPDVDTACEKTVQITGRVQPNPNHSAIYREMYECYRALYPALKPAFNMMAAASERSGE
jgi:xylulokinase